MLSRTLHPPPLSVCSHSGSKMSLLLLFREESGKKEDSIAWDIKPYKSDTISWELHEAVRHDYTFKDAVLILPPMVDLITGLGIAVDFIFRNMIYLISYGKICTPVSLTLYSSVINSLLTVQQSHLELSNKLGFDPLRIESVLASRLGCARYQSYTDIITSITKAGKIDIGILNYIGNKLQKDLDLLNSILDNTPLERRYSIKNSIDSAEAYLHWGDFKLKADQGPWVATGDWDIKLDGESIKEYVSAVSINLNEDHFTNSFEATIDCVELWDRLEPDGSQDLRITIKIGIDLFKFLLETRKLSGSVSERSISIWGRGKTAVLDSPYMLKLEDEYASEGMASDIIQSLAPGFTIDFRIPDYFIPGETLELAGRSRIEVISEIARAGGGIVRCGPQGELVIRPKHPFDPDTMNLESPVWEYSDFDDVIQLDEEWLQESGYNAILVESEVPSNAGTNVSGTIVLDEELSPTPLREGDPVYVRVYLVAIPDFSDPNYPGSFYELRVTDGSTVYRGTIVKEETEVVQVTANQGSARYPILELVSYDWIGLDAGDLQVDPKRENKLVLTPSGSRTEGLVRVTYRTAYDSWQLIGANENTILFVAAKEI